MPRYFFHVCDSSVGIDSEGTELSSPSEAKREAMRTAAEMLRDARADVWPHSHWQMHVNDESRRLILKLCISVEEMQARRPAA